MIVFVLALLKPANATATSRAQASEDDLFRSNFCRAHQLARHDLPRPYMPFPNYCRLLVNRPQ